jgi:hypothetical protein
MVYTLRDNRSKRVAASAYRAIAHNSELEGYSDALRT